MNLKARHPGFKVWAGAQADMDRIATIWSECFARYGGPYLFGEQLTMADAMYAPSSRASSPTMCRSAANAPPIAVPS